MVFVLYTEFYFEIRASLLITLQNISYVLTFLVVARTQTDVGEDWVRYQISPMKLVAL